MCSAFYYLVPSMSNKLVSRAILTEYLEKH